MLRIIACLPTVIARRIVVDPRRIQYSAIWLLWHSLTPSRLLSLTPNDNTVFYNCNSTIGVTDWQSHMYMSEERKVAEKREKKQTCRIQNFHNIYLIPAN
jgi:hypothetical protein